MDRADHRSLVHYGHRTLEPCVGLPQGRVVGIAEMPVPCEHPLQRGCADPGFERQDTGRRRGRGQPDHRAVFRKPDHLLQHPGLARAREPLNPDGPVFGERDRSNRVPLPLRQRRGVKLAGAFFLLYPDGYRYTPGDYIWGGNENGDGDDGDDTIEGGKGNDWLSGGNNYGVGTDGSDRFVFGSGDGTDTILDFEEGKDILVIKGGLKFSDLAITNNAKGHAVITGYGENDSITLKGVSASILTDSDFDFIA